VNDSHDKLHGPSICGAESSAGAVLSRAVQSGGFIVTARGGTVSGERAPIKRSDGELFAAAAAAVARGDDLDDALAQLLGLAAEYIGASSGAIYILDQDRDDLSLTVSSGVAAEIAAEAAEIGDVTNSHDPLADAARSRLPLKVEDAAHVAILRGAKTAILLPMVVRRDDIEVALGVLALGFAGGLPPQEILSGAEPLADLAAVAVERALALALGSERAEWFDRLAHIDPLTGLPNRRTIERILEMEVARAGRQGVPMSLALVQLDCYDEIQRTAGNAAADTVLRRVAQVLSESIRLVDTAARISDGQFMVIAPGPDALVLAERVVRGIGALPAVGEIAVSASVGMANFPLDGRMPEELLAVAERVMAAAHEAGGGRVGTQPAAAE
jgi:diguanylate cyclase (GGDEF)-like protein